MRRRHIARAAGALALLVVLTLAACKSYGSSDGDNPNMEALNEHYGIEAGDPGADHVPLFLYYADAPRPAPAATAPAQPAIASTAPANRSG